MNIQSIEVKLQNMLSNARMIGSYKEPIPSIRCANGLVLSVQASSFHYCYPRSNRGPYSTVEVGFPSEAIETLMAYAENPEEPTDTVYSQVPIKTVCQVILDNGGFAQ